MVVSKKRPVGVDEKKFFFFLKGGVINERYQGFLKIFLQCIITALATTGEKNSGV